MPELQISSVNINNFQFNATFNLRNRTVTFDASRTTYFSTGIDNVLGISFELIDGDGVTLASIDFVSPQISTPNTGQIYTLDLSNVNFAFLFQTYKITGAIKDANGTVYQTTPVYKKICQPVNFNDSGYVPGIFQITPDCPNNTLTIKELSLLVYNNLTPFSVVKTGILSYPTGTIASVNFASTPFSNNVIYTGQYRINCTTDTTYDLGDGVYVDVTYLTNNVFDVTCNNKMSDLMCCIVGIQDTFLKNCNIAIGKHAKQQLDDITIPFLIGMTKEINGQDASTEAMLIKKQLNCDCGSSSLGQNEISPINPSVYSIVIQGVGGTTVPSATIVGSTKTYNVASNTYQVVKGNTGDLAWTITVDTSVAYIVKYKITFDYKVMAGYILNAIASDSTLLNQLNSLINTVGNVSLVGLNGKCVLNMSLIDYTLIQTVNNSTIITNVTINGIIYNAPSNLFGTDFIGIANWLNSLSLGLFTSTVNSGTLLIQSLQNVNVISTMTFTTPNLIVKFQSSSKTIVQVLQSIVNYICGITSLQIALGENLSLCLFDYNGNVIGYNYSSTLDTQGTFNLGISQAICNIVSRINTLTGITCDKLKAAFPDSPGGSFGIGDRMYGTLGGFCAGLTDQQIAKLVIAAVGKYSDVKTQWCAIDCSIPGTCPEVGNINMSMAGGSIGIYGLTWVNPQPIASQTVTVRYRITGTTVWTTATGALLIQPNGNISGSSPFLILGVTAGATYDVFILNNCGGSGIIKQITTPTGTVYSGNFLLDSVLYSICGRTPVTLYSNAPFATGIIMYTNIGLTVQVTGDLFIVPVVDGRIFNINSITGVVGSYTGSNCNSGIAGSFLLGNSTSTICSGSPVTLYTGTGVAVGQTVYTDSGLTSPQTGFSYIADNSTGKIYNFNSATGAIVSDTGLTCTPTVIFQQALGFINITSLSGIPGFTYSPVSGNFYQTGVHPAFTGVITGNFNGTVPSSVPFAIRLFKNSVVQGCYQYIPGTYSSSFTFPSTSFLEGDEIRIDSNMGSC